MVIIKAPISSMLEKFLQDKFEKNIVSIINFNFPCYFRYVGDYIIVNVLNNFRLKIQCSTEISREKKKKNK